MLENLNSRQKEILEYIIDYIQKKGYPPSVREIGKAVGLSSSSTVHSHLSQLEKRGYLRKDPTKPRTIELLINSKDENIPYIEDVMNVPVLGRITAGEPILAEENTEEFVPLPISLTGKDPVFILKVKGNSMIEAGILCGDNVIVKKQVTANNGDIVAALLEDEATVKRFYKEKDHVRLQPENSSMDSIIVKEIRILGKVVGVYRKIN